MPEECNYPSVSRLLINVIYSLQLIVGVPTCAKSEDITITMEPWTFRSESNKHGSTKKNIDFPPPVGSDTKVSFPAVVLCTASRCSYLSVTHSFLLVWSKA